MPTMSLYCSRDGVLLLPFPHPAHQAADRGGLQAAQDHHQVPPAARDHPGRADGHHLTQRR